MVEECIKQKEKEEFLMKLCSIEKMMKRRRQQKEHKLRRLG